MALTPDEANLVVQLYRSSTEGNHRKAMGFIFSDGFVEDGAEFEMKYPPGTDESVYVATVSTWFETIATLRKHGALNDEFLFDWLGVDMVWNRLSGVLLHQREKAGEPRLWENFEAMAKASAA